MIFKKSSNKFNLNLNPYLRLIRIDKPIGAYLLLLPALWAIFLASGGKVELNLILIFIIGSFLMRGAGCIINDIIDRKLDAKVQRCANRPLACGDLSLLQALIFLAFILLVSLMLLLTMNKLAIIIGFIAIIPVALYPLMKRITFWPQIFLGFTFNFSIIIAWAATTGKLQTESFLLYFAGLFWTLGYDTIYAHQDKIDDVKVGVKSTALILKDKTKVFLTFCYFNTSILITTCLILHSASLISYLIILIATAQLFWQIYSVNLDEPDDCLNKFKSNQWFGILVLLAIIASTI